MLFPTSKPRSRKAPAQAALETATLTADGHIRFTTVNKGPANLSLFIGDAAGNTGSTNFPNFAQTQAGTGPDTAVSSIDVIDPQGRTQSSG